jgi:hypothetical protein
MKLNVGDIGVFIHSGEEKIGRIFKMGAGDRVYVRYYDPSEDAFLNLKVSGHGLSLANSEQERSYLMSARKYARRIESANRGCAK